jgi:hypothetical protein
VYSPLNAGGSNEGCGFGRGSTDMRCEDVLDDVGALFRITLNIRLRVWNTDELFRP